MKMTIVNDDKDDSPGDEISGDDKDEPRGQASEPEKAKGSEASSRMSHAGFRTSRP